MCCLHSVSRQHRLPYSPEWWIGKRAGPAGWTLTQTTSPTPPPGDYNDNGITDAADYVVWRKTDSTAAELLDQWPSTTTLAVTSTSRHAGIRWQNKSPKLKNHLPPADGLLLKPYAGNTYPYFDQNLPVNVWLTQTYVAGPSAAGKTYTFSGDSTYQGAYSGNIDMLYPDSPSGTDSCRRRKPNSKSRSSTPATSCLAHRHSICPNIERTPNPSTWQTSSLSALAPTGTFKVQVTLAATNMVASCTSSCPFGQDVRFDNFSLKDSIATTTDRLLNGNLDMVGVPADWTLQTVGNDAVQFSTADFAVHSGNVGMWLRTFQGNNPTPPPNGPGNPGPIDAVISQIVPGTPGTSYTFSAWAKLQEGYSGLDPTSGTQTFITMEFLDSGGATIDSPVSLELGPNGPLGSNFWPPGPDNGQGVWQQVSLPATIAPAGTVNIRVSGGATGMITEVDRFPDLAESALFDDFSLIMGGSGSGSGNLLTGSLAAASVPEPATRWLAFVSAVGCLLVRRRGGLG